MFIIMNFYFLMFGNTIRDYNSPFDKSDIYLNNHFYLRMGYNIPKTFSESDLLINPFTKEPSTMS